MRYIEDGRAWLIIVMFYLVGLVIGLIRSICIKKLQRESLRFSTTKNNYLKHMKLKYENICKLEKSVYSSHTFVEKNILDSKCCGINIYTMKYINRVCNAMIIYLGMFFVGYAYFHGVEFRSDIVCLYGMGSVAMSCSLTLLELIWMPEMRMQRTIINISAYLDNHRNKCQIQPEKIKQVKKQPEVENTGKNFPLKSNDDIKLLYERESSDNKLIEDILREYLC